MGSEVKSGRLGIGVSVAVGERVTLDDSNTEYVVVNVDHVKGRVELLQLKPGRIESDVPFANLHKKGPAPNTGPSRGN